MTLCDPKWFQDDTAGGLEKHFTYLGLSLIIVPVVDDIYGEDC